VYEEAVMEKKIKIEVKGEIESAREFVEAWDKAERGKSPEQPVDRLYFEDLGTLLKFLTPKRLEALKVLHDKGPMSVRALAKSLERDYKNVHRDMQTMERAGLVSRNEEGLLIVPWNSIMAEVPLAA
jgi:predicted transcriptional regulator